MPFESKSLRVQLPCKGITLIRDEEDPEVRWQVHKYWRDVVLTPIGADNCGSCTACTGCTDCSSVTDRCIGRSEAGELCNNTDPLDVLIRVDARILPVLRKQLEARLQEIIEAEQVVAKETGGR